MYKVAFSCSSSFVVLVVVVFLVLVVAVVVVVVVVLDVVVVAAACTPATARAACLRLCLYFGNFLCKTNSVYKIIFGTFLLEKKQFSEIRAVRNSSRFP